MVPPGALDYYFSTEERVLHARNLPSKDSGSGEAVKHRGPVESMDVPRMNYIENVLQTRQIVTKTLLTNMTCIPRPPPKFLKPVERLKTPWDFFQSVFKDYRPDNEVLLAKCF